MKIALHPYGMNNVRDPLFVSELKADKAYHGCRLLQNMDPRNDESAFIRPGQTQNSGTPCHSGWSFDNKIAYMVRGSNLVSWDGTSFSVLAAVVPNLRMAFCQANDVVVFSNGVDFGVIENGAVVTPFTPTLPLHIPMQPGQRLAFYNGRLYSAHLDTLFFSGTMSDPGGIEAMKQKNVAIQCDSRITEVLALEKGIFVGTETETWFLYGVDPLIEPGFDHQYIASDGVIFGSGTYAPARLIPKLNSPKGMAAVWASFGGIYAGRGDGFAVNLSENQVVYPSSMEGAGILREMNGEAHYLASIAPELVPFNQFVPHVVQTNSADTPILVT